MGPMRLMGLMGPPHKSHKSHESHKSHKACRAVGLAEVDPIPSQGRACSYLPPTPTRPYADTPIRRHADTPTRSYLGTLGANSCENACSSHGLAS